MIHARAAVDKPHRHIRSFVRREGRLTAGQRNALTKLWPRFGLAPEVALDPERTFGRSAPLALEIGFGAGENLIEQARARLDWNHIGIEVYRPGVGRLLRTLERADLQNVRVYQADAVEVLAHCIPPAGLQRVQLLFPDPWPKKRHHKRRLVQPEFAALVRERLAPDGEWHLATDWAPYAEHMLAVLQALPGLENAAPDGHFMQTPAQRTVTRFENRGHKLGHRVFDLVFRRTGEESFGG